MKHYIDSEWVDKDDKIGVYDPYDNSLIDYIPKADIYDVQKALDAAEKGYHIARKMPVHERAQLLYSTADIIKRKAEEFARLLARESSKTIREARKEVGRCVNTLTVSGEEAKRIHGETISFDSYPGGENRKGYYYHNPIGIILAITPFNDPLNLVAHKLGPAFAGGNSVILKPSTVTPLSAIKLAEAFLEAGLPPGVLQILTGNSSEIGMPLIRDERIKMISFTGGINAGNKIASISGIKKLAMELGSNSPVIVWRDCDIDWAVESCVSGSFWAAGQNCLGVQRIYIHNEIYEEFKRKFLKKTSQLKVGNKLSEETDMGPMITSTEAIRVEKLINDAVGSGAKVLCGGRRDGAFYDPTVLENVPKTCQAYREEIFGPVVHLFPIDDFDNAIEEANSLEFGLHAAVFTKDINLAFKAAYEIECGGVMINDSTDYRLDSMPFGGVKNSGLGREGIKFALQEMTEPKVICFHHN
ncbi:MAG: aldehyde dehydrogenase [Desulfobulbaceae bacterium S3730MH12]|nr:MAG: aldehyde dehydrogenase [Desulfobulbaceae bacterium S3730MH12]